MSVTLDREQTLKLLDLVEEVELSTDYNPYTKQVGSITLDFTKQGTELASLDSEKTVETHYWNNGEYLGEFVVTDQTLELIRKAIESEIDDEERDQLIASLQKINKELVPANLRLLELGVQSGVVVEEGILPSTLYPGDMLTLTLTVKAVNGSTLTFEGFTEDLSLEELQPVVTDYTLGKTGKEEKQKHLKKIEARKAIEAMDLDDEVKARLLEVL